jgi:surface protein
MYYKNLFLIFPFVFLLFSSFLKATMYEDAENNSTEKWTVYDKETIYDKNVTTKILKTIYDDDKKSNVIQIKGKNLTYTFLIGDIKGDKAWKNKDESILTWSMKMKKPYQLMLFVNTKKGIRYLYFSYNVNSKILNNSNYIHVDLNSSSISEEWQTYSFDIASKIKSHDANNSLISINGLSIQGSGLIDDIALSSNKNDFISTIKINKEKKLRISTNDIFKYNFNINWGDGSRDFNVKKNISHLYEKEGVYTISINGDYPHIYNLCSDTQTLLSIEQWGSQKWKSMKESFKDCKDFSTIHTNEAPDLSNVKSMYRMFYNNYKFNTNISSWDVSTINDMSSMFYHAEKFNQDIGAWDLSSVKDTSFMFNNALVFNQDIGHWDVSSVEDMQLMFRSAKKFNQDISLWDVSSVKTMYNMFKGATSFHQNLDNWNTSSIRDNSKLKVKRKIVPTDTPIINNIYNELERLNGPNDTNILP